MIKSSAKKEFFNKKARYDFGILESFEVGVVLDGEEIKAIRNGRVDMTSSYAKIMNGEVWWLGASINVLSGDRQRTRKLLLHKLEIEKLSSKVAEKGLTLVPIKLYLTRGKAKLELGVGKGLKRHDKREKLKKADQEMEIQRKIKQFK